jgi:SAM-dependent methyltransferase
LRGVKEPDRSPLDLQVGYWDRVGPAKSFSHPIDIGRFETLVKQGALILDFGCGYGRVLRTLHEHGYRNLFGVDPSPAMVAAARAQLPDIAIDLLVNPPHVRRPDASCDAVLLVSVLTCVPTDQGQESILHEAHRLLRPGGALCINDFWLQTDARNQARYERGARTHGTHGVFDLPEGVTLRHHDQAWIEHLTRSFTSAALEHVDVTTMNGHTARGFQWLGTKS